MDPKEDHPNEDRNRKLRNVASLLLGRPDLARLVRCFEWRDESLQFEGMEQSEESEERVSSHTVEVDQTFKTAVTALGLPKKEEENWLRQLSHSRKCHPEVILALLLPALLGVEKLVLDLESSFTTPYLEQTIIRATHKERPFDIQPPFKALKVFLQYDDYFHHTNSRSTCFIASLLMLPAIRVISAQVASQPDPRMQETYTIGENKNPIGLDSTSSPLTSLYLSAYSLSVADLVYILRAPKALKDFVYKFEPSAGITFTDVRHALEPQKCCLERLGFDYDERCQDCLPIDKEIEYFDRRYHYISGSMISFDSFNTIKVFETAALFLPLTIDGPIPINTFPPNLETLRLTHCEPRYMEDTTEQFLIAVKNLLAQKSPQQMPSLKKVILEEGRRKDEFMARDDLWTMVHDVYDRETEMLKMMEEDGVEETRGHSWTLPGNEDAILELKEVAANQGVAIELR